MPNATPTTAKQLVITGKIIIYWNPEKDPRERNKKPLMGYQMVRPFDFYWVDEVKSKQVKEAAKVSYMANSVVDVTNPNSIPSMPQFKALQLGPGINWVDSAKWKEAQAGSTAKYNADVAAGQASSDVMADMLSAGALVAYAPTPDAVERGLRHNLDDYSEKDILTLISEIRDANTLREMMVDCLQEAPKQAIRMRIKGIEQGLI